MIVPSTGLPPGVTGDNRSTISTTEENSVLSGGKSGKPWRSDGTKPKAGLEDLKVAAPPLDLSTRYYLGNENMLINFKENTTSTTAKTIDVGIDRGTSQLESRSRNHYTK